MAYAALGWPVFPLKPRGKGPLTEHGFLDATTNPATIREWWDEWPSANVGIRTGNGLTVIDVDPRDRGNESLAGLEQKHAPLPQTLTARSGGGGLHIYLATNGHHIRCSAGKLGPGLDVRAEGGYIVASPSVHENGGLYEWLNDDALAMVPDWLVKALTEPQAGTRTVEGAIPEGKRNSTLMSIAGVMRRYGVSVGAVEAALLEENRQRCTPPLSEGEVRRIARSAGRYAPDAMATPDLFKAPTIAELLAKAPERPASIIEGLFFRSMKTVTIGIIKVGKTTLSLRAMDAVSQSKPFLGLKTTCVPILVVTEQSEASFLAQVRIAGLAEQTVRSARLITQGDLMGLDWPSRARLIGDAAKAHEAGFVRLDTFSRIALVTDENDAAKIQAAVDVLERHLPPDVAVELVQHERKSGGEIESAGRGNSALGGCVDVLFRIVKVAGHGHEYQRDVQTTGRPATAFEEPKRIELASDGYRLVGNVSASDARDLENAILELFPGPPLTVEEITKRTRSRRTNVQRVLNNLVKDHVFCATGEGKKGDPKRYRPVKP